MTRNRFADLIDMNLGAGSYQCAAVQDGTCGGALRDDEEEAFDLIGFWISCFRELTAMTLWNTYLLDSCHLHHGRHEVKGRGVKGTAAGRG